MQLGEKAEEILETLWIRTEEQGEASIPVADLEVMGKESLKELTGGGHVTVTEGRVKLTDAGRPEATSVVRRHRLAERLLADVLDAGDVLIHERACKFEHLLDRGLDESVCSLLGHPKICPHGKRIPPGACCQQEQAHVQRLVSPLAQLREAQKGKVAYIYAPESGELQKLMAMGVLPGAGITLVQRFPSYVFQIGQTQFAVDKQIADAIYVRLVEARAPAEAGPDGAAGNTWRMGRNGWHFGLGRLKERWQDKPDARP